MQKECEGKEKSRKCVEEERSMDKKCVKEK
jgi:hypothetical protein